MMQRSHLAGPLMALLLAAGCAPEGATPPPARAASGAQAAVAQAPARQPVPSVATVDETVPVADLVAVLRADADPAARRDSVYELADSGSDADAGFVGQALGDPDPRVRRAAIEALSGFEADSAIGYLAIALNDADPKIRLEAAEALGNFGNAEAKAALQQAAIDADPAVREAAEELLAEPETETGPG